MKPGRGWKRCFMARCKGKVRKGTVGTDAFCTPCRRRYGLGG